MSDLLTQRLANPTVPQPVRLPAEQRIPRISEMEPHERGFVRSGCVVIDGAERVWCDTSEIFTSVAGRYGCDIEILRTEHGVTLRVPNNYYFSRTRGVSCAPLLPVFELEFFDADAE